MASCMFLSRYSSSLNTVLFYSDLMSHDITRLRNVKNETSPRLAVNENMSVLHVDWINTFPSRLIGYPECTSVPLYDPEIDLPPRMQVTIPSLTEA